MKARSWGQELDPHPDPHPHLLDLSRESALALLALRLYGEPWLSSQTREELPGYVADLGWRLLEQSPPGVDGEREAFALAEVVGASRA